MDGPTTDDPVWGSGTVGFGVLTDALGRNYYEVSGTTQTETRTVTTTTTTTEIMLRPTNDDVCTISLSDYTDDAPQLLIDEEDSNYPDCLGAYEISLNVADSCADDTDAFVLDFKCSEPPVAIGFCDKFIDYDYIAGEWPFIDVEGRDSYDLDTGIDEYEWHITAVPAGSAVVVPQLFSTLDDELNAYRVDREGTWEVTLTVRDECTEHIDKLTIEARCGDSVTAAQAAIADWTWTGAAVQPPVDASASTFPETAGGTYAFEITAYPPALDTYDYVLGAVSTTLYAGPSPTPTVTIADVAAGTYTVEMTVTDGCTFDTASRSFTIDCDEATFDVDASDSTPSTSTFNVASDTFATVTLDAGSSVLVSTYRWRVTSAPDGSTAAPANAALASTTIVPDLPGSYTVELFGSSGCSHAIDTFTFTADCPTDPTYTLPADFDVDSTDATSTVTPATDTSAAGALFIVSVLSGATGGVSNNGDGTFDYTPRTAPDDMGAVSVQVQVDYKTCGIVATDTITITNVCDETGWTLTSDAGSDQISTFASSFERIELDGDGSDVTGAAGYSHLWTVVSAPEGSIYYPDPVLTAADPVVMDGAPIYSNLNGTHARYLTTDTSSIAYTRVTRTVYLDDNVDADAMIAPTCFTPDLPGDYVLELALEYNCKIDTDTVTVTAACNDAPVARAGSDMNVEATNQWTRVVLDGSASTKDADSDELTFNWELTSAPRASPLYWVGADGHNHTTNWEGEYPSVLVDVEGEYTFRLTVSDGCASDTDDVTLTVTCGSTMSLDGFEVERTYDGATPLSSEIFALGDDDDCERTYEWVKYEFTVLESAAPAAIEDEGLTRGQIIGIVAGAVAGLALLILLVVAIVYCCKNKKSKSASVSPADAEGGKSGSAASGSSESDN